MGQSPRKCIVEQLKFQYLALRGHMPAKTLAEVVAKSKVHAVHMRDIIIDFDPDAALIANKASRQHTRSGRLSDGRASPAGEFRPGKRTCLRRIGFTETASAAFTT
jgi:hypothetical protein